MKKEKFYIGQRVITKHKIKFDAYDQTCLHADGTKTTNTIVSIYESERGEIAKGEIMGISNGILDIKFNNGHRYIINPINNFSIKIDKEYHRNKSIGDILNGK